MANNPINLIDPNGQSVVTGTVRAVVGIAITIGGVMVVVNTGGLMSVAGFDLAVTGVSIIGTGISDIIKSTHISCSVSK